MTSNTHTPKNTTAFYAQAAISFGVALFSIGLGVAYLPAIPGHAPSSLSAPCSS